MTNLSGRLNFSSKESSNSIEIKKWNDVNHYETLLKYCSDNDIDSTKYIDPECLYDDFDACAELMGQHGQEDKSTDTYHFSID